MKVLVVDDHVLIREALRGVLDELRDDTVVVEAGDARRARQAIAEHRDLDMVLLDIGLPDGSGFDLLADLRENHPAISVVMLSGHDESDEMARALDLGAVGFIPKSARREVMLSAFELIFSGGVYVPPEILRRPAAVPPTRPANLELTERQMAVLALMMQGKSNKAICRALDIAEPTVKNHVTAILKALKVTNRTEAVIAAAALGLAGRQRDG
jgi:DNA-binding NarL/FixJ family response regulator